MKGIREDFLPVIDFFSDRSGDGLIKSYDDLEDSIYSCWYVLCLFYSKDLTCQLDTYVS